MKKTAKEWNQIFWRDFNKKLKIEWLECYNQKVIHVINKLKVIQLNECVQVVNTESLVANFFDNEEMAIDYCLSVYPETKITKQEELFNQT